MDLKTFLTNCKSFVRTSLGKKPLTWPKIHLVMGTEACDLDSAVSAVVYAHFLNHVNYKTSNIENTFLPILNTKCKSLRTKLEIIYAFGKINIEPSTLICIDEIDFQKIKENGKLAVTLVDHNVLASQNIFLTDDVVEIIDHHKNEMGDVYKSLTRTVIEPVGSCATLIAEDIFSKEPNLLQEFKEISTLLYETILLDTNNLSEETKKATEKDISMVKQLEDILGVYNRKDVYHAILQARMDISGLTFTDLLVQDLKVISENGISLAVPTVLKSLKDVENLKEELEKFCKENSYDAVVVTSVIVNDHSVSRDMAIYTNAKLLNIIETALLNAENGALNLKLLSREPTFALFKQQNSQLSRKFVLPVLRNYFKRNDSNEQS